MKFVFRISGSKNFVVLIEDSDTDRQSSITVRMKYVFAFQIWYCELCVKKPMREAESIILIIVLSSFLLVKSFLKIWANDFSSLLIFESFKVFFAIIFKNWCKLARVGIKGSWFVNHESVSWPTNQKFVKLQFFTNCFFQNMVISKKSVQTILSVYVSRVKWMRLIDERQKFCRMFWLVLNYGVIS